MLIRDSKWDEIRHLFTEEEKQQLGSAVAGQAICPRGYIVDEDQLEDALRAKLRAALNTKEKGR